MSHGAESALAGNEQVNTDMRRFFANNGASSEIIDDLVARYQSSQSSIVLSSDQVTTMTTDSEEKEDNGEDRQITASPVGDSALGEPKKLSAKKKAMMERRTLLANELTYLVLHTVTSNSYTNTQDRAKHLRMLRSHRSARRFERLERKPSKKRTRTR